MPKISRSDPQTRLQLRVGGWQWMLTMVEFCGQQQTLLTALLMVLLVLQMVFSLLDQLIEWDTYMQLMQRVGKFYGPIKLEPVSMEACQSTKGASMWAMDTVLLMGLT